MTLKRQIFVSAKESVRREARTMQILSFRRYKKRFVLTIHREVGTGRQVVSVPPGVWRRHKTSPNHDSRRGGEALAHSPSDDWALDAAR